MVQSVPTEATVERGQSSTKLTYADYVLFPDDGVRYASRETPAGQVRDASSPGPEGPGLLLTGVAVLEVGRVPAWCHS